RGARISLTRFEVVVMLRIHITMVALSVLAFGIVAGRPEVVHAQAQMPTVGAEFPIIPDGVESRAITWENPTGEKGAGGKAGGGRKGAPCIPQIANGETVTLMDVAGPGVIRHIWITIPDR